MPAAWPHRGEIWLVYTPGQPDDPHQPRPALVISENVRNRLSEDLTVIPIFSEGRLGPTRVALPVGMGGIHHDSVLFCEEITTIRRDFLVEGPLAQPVLPQVLRQAVAGVRRALGEVVPELAPGPGY